MRERLRICLNKQDIVIKELVPNALIAHLGVATVDDMEDGAVIINLGGGLTDVTVIQSGKVRYFASIPMSRCGAGGRQYEPLRHHAIHGDFRCGIVCLRGAGAGFDLSSLQKSGQAYRGKL